ncbi:hypothetical protein ACFX19_028277 [Malus domestica]
MDFYYLPFTCWQIWKARCSFIHDTGKSIPHLFLRSQIWHLATIMTPLENFVKVNYDGAWSKDPGDAGLGVVVIDFNGDLVDGLANYCKASSSVQVKFQAVVEGLRLVKAKISKISSLRVTRKSA